MIFLALYFVTKPTVESAIGLSLREGGVGLCEGLTVRAAHERDLRQLVGDFPLASPNP